MVKHDFELTYLVPSAKAVYRCLACGLTLEPHTYMVMSGDEYCSSEQAAIFATLQKLKTLPDGVVYQDPDWDSAGSSDEAGCGHCGLINFPISDTYDKNSDTWRCVFCNTRNYAFKREEQEFI